jgi:hypothetical protein
MVYKRNTNLYAPLTIEAVIDFLEKGKPSPDSKHVAELLLEVCKAAPIEINNMYLFAWWFNYAIFWDCVCSRVYAQTTLDVAQPSKLIQFYNTDKFQKWGIHFHKQFPDQYGEFENYKKASKDMITSILAIPEYKDKFKFNSFPVIHSLKPNGLFVDDQLAVYRDLADIVKFV